MSGNERRSEWLVLLGIGLVLWGGWWLLNGFLAPLLWPLRAFLDAVARVGWPLAIIAMGVLVIVTAHRGGQFVVRGRRLYRSRTNRMVGGVLAGVADFFSIDPTLVRLIYAALAFFTSFFPAFVLYIIAMVVIPEEPVATGVDAYPAATAPAPPIPTPPAQPAPGPAPETLPAGAPAPPPAPPSQVPGPPASSE